MRWNTCRNLVKASVAVGSLLGGLAPLGATEISFSVSFPAVFEFTPPANPDLEGSRTVTAHADGEIRPVEAYAWLERLDASTFATVFGWAQTQPRLARFTNADAETLDVVFAPTSALPLDLARHQLPVIHIQLDPAGLWDPETGIYVWGHHDNFLQRGDAWERAATLDYYEADGSLAFHEPIGLRINGESSREYAQKGLRLYFDDYGDADHIEHDFFGDGPVRCERLVLRGNRYADFAIGSGMMEPLHRELGHPGSRWAYVAVYVNDEYWGAYSLRERFDAKWVETTHEWADDDYLIVKDHEAEVGEYSRWEQVLAGCQPPANPAAHAWFQWLESELDVTSYLDWILVNAVGMTADNMAGKNLAILKIGGQPCRYMTWDEDILFQTANRNADHFSFYAAGNGAEFFAYQPPAWYSGGPWEFTFFWNMLLRAGMQNAEFKARLRERAAELLAGPLAAPALDARLTALAARQGPEWVHHDLRWNSPGTYDGKVLAVRSQFPYRSQKVAELVTAFLATWADPVELTAFTVALADGGRRLTWRTAREEDCLGWIVERSVGTLEDFSPIATWLDHPALAAGGGPDLPCNYAWVDTAALGGAEVSYRLAHADGTGATVTHDWIERVGLPASFSLRLNEVLADNDGVNSDEAGEFDDWLEIVNTGSETVDLDGLYLTDNLDNPTKWRLPAMDLAPGAFVLIWCDEDPGQGPLHASFKLSAAGEEIGLFADLASGNLPIDTLVFGPQTTDVSLGRAVDGTGPWVLFAVPTPNASNVVATSVTPSLVDGDAPHLGRPWPNPTSAGLRVAGRLPAVAPAATLRVYDARGALVRELWSGVADAATHTWTWDGRDGAGRAAPAGVYVLRLQAGAQVDQQRVVLLK